MSQLLNRQTVFISLTSGAVSVLGYIFLKKLICCRHTCKHVAKKTTTKQEQSKIYEDKVLLDQYMLFNYCEGRDLLLFDLKSDADVNNCFLFPKRVALLCKDFCPDLFFSDNVSFRLCSLYLI